MENLLLSPISLEQLKAVISNTVRVELARQLDGRNGPKEDTKLLTRKEAAHFLGVSLPTLLEFTKSGKITGYRISTRVRYKRAELEQSLKQIRSANTKRV
jgi:excisionase family DNA binding protein